VEIHLAAAQHLNLSSFSSPILWVEIPNYGLCEIEPKLCKIRGGGHEQEISNAGR
jgi:hypothetical protein